MDEPGGSGRRSRVGAGRRWFEFKSAWLPAAANQTLKQMNDNVIPYLEMCRREGANLQRGMNYGLGGNHSVILMSIRPNAPYRDQLEDGGTTLIYEGHDQPKTKDCPSPKVLDQLLQYPSGALNENGKFHRAAQDAAAGIRLPERVRVYEKLHTGIWDYNGVFHLVQSWPEPDGSRTVFKFRLVAVDGDENLGIPPSPNPVRRRIIPTTIKLEVWKRDAGRCVICSATDELHFDHDLPWSKGGTSVTAANVQVLCARHNLQKHDRIV
jgi:HNH endonuclease